MTQEDWEQRQRWVWSVSLLLLGTEGFSCISSHLAQQEERKHHRGFGWLLRFAQAAAPGHCCWWGNFTTEVCVLSSRDGSLTTRNSSSHCVSCFLNSLRIKSLWHCFLRLRFPTESQNTAVPIFWHCQGCIFTCWLNVHWSLCTGSTAFPWLCIREKTANTGSSWAKRKSILIPQDRIIGVEKRSH